MKLRPSAWKSRAPLMSSLPSIPRSLNLSMQTMTTNSLHGRLRIRAPFSLTVMRNSSSIVSSTTGRSAKAFDTLCVGAAKALVKTDGSKEPIWTTTKRWTSTGLLLLCLSVTCFPFACGSFSHWVFNAPVHGFSIHFYLLPLPFFPFS